MRFSESFNPRFNVKIVATDSRTGEVVATRDVHNVITNAGKTWMSQLWGSSDYTQIPPTAHTTQKIMYMGFGCGGALQTSLMGGAVVPFANLQQELVTVTALEDAVPYNLAGDYAKVLENQKVNDVYFPGNYRSVHALNVAESEISFTNNVTSDSATIVGTAVPISEAALFLNTPFNIASATNAAIGYNIFDPIVVTPNVILRVEWELRL